MTSFFYKNLKTSELYVQKIFSSYVDPQTLSLFDIAIAISLSASECVLQTTSLPRTSDTTIATYIATYVSYHSHMYIIKRGTFNLLNLHLVNGSLTIR